MDEVILKTPEEIEIIHQNGKILAEILRELLDMAKPGVTTLDIDKKADELVAKHGVKAAFKGFEGYPYGLVACVNEEVVHGMPSKDRVLKDGDVLTLDYGVYANEYYSDMARTIVVGNSTPELDAFLETGKRALLNAIDKAKIGGHLGDIGHAIQSTVEGDAYSVVRAFVGHGVGRDLHEDPQVYGVGVPGRGMLLKEGLVIAIEIMYMMGSYEVEILDDGWTAVTADGSISGMFENTVAITRKGPLILTPLPL